eukprot:g24168.t1
MTGKSGVGSSEDVRNGLISKGELELQRERDEALEIERNQEIMQLRRVGSEDAVQKIHALEQENQRARANTEERERLFKIAQEQGQRVATVVPPKQTTGGWVNPIQARLAAGKGDLPVLDSSQRREQWLEQARKQEEMGKNTLTEESEEEEKETDEDNVDPSQNTLDSEQKRELALAEEARKEEEAKEQRKRQEEERRLAQLQADRDKRMLMEREKAESAREGQKGITDSPGQENKTGGWVNPIQARLKQKQSEQEAWKAKAALMSEGELEMAIQREEEADKERHAELLRLGRVGNDRKKMHQLEEESAQAKERNQERQALLDAGLDNSGNGNGETKDKERKDEVLSLASHVKSPIDFWKKQEHQKKVARQGSAKNEDKPGLAKKPKQGGKLHNLFQQWEAKCNVKKRSAVEDRQTVSDEKKQAALERKQSSAESRRREEEEYRKLILDSQMQIHASMEGLLSRQTSADPPQDDIPVPSLVSSVSAPNATASLPVSRVPLVSSISLPGRKATVATSTEATSSAAAKRTLTEATSTQTSKHTSIEATSTLTTKKHTTEAEEGEEGEEENEGNEEGKDVELGASAVSRRPVNKESLEQEEEEYEQVRNAALSKANEVKDMLSQLTEDKREELLNQVLEVLQGRSL